MRRLGIGLLFVLATAAGADELLYRSIADELVQGSQNAAERGELIAARSLLERAIAVDPAHGDANWLIVVDRLSIQEETRATMGHLETALAADRLVTVERSAVRLAYARLLLATGRATAVIDLYNRETAQLPSERETLIAARLAADEPWRAAAQLYAYREDSDRTEADRLYFERQEHPSLELLSWLENTPPSDGAYLDVLHRASGLYEGTVLRRVADYYYSLGGVSGEPAARVVVATEDGNAPAEYLERVLGNGPVRAEELSLLLESSLDRSVVTDAVDTAEALFFDADDDGRREALLTLRDGTVRSWVSDVDADGEYELALFRGATLFLARVERDGVVALRYDPYPFVRDVIVGTSDDITVRSLRQTWAMEFASLEHLLRPGESSIAEWVSLSPASLPIEDIARTIGAARSLGALVFSRVEEDFARFLAENGL